LAFQIKRKTEACNPDPTCLSSPHFSLNPIGGNRVRIAGFHLCHNTIRAKVNRYVGWAVNTVPPGPKHRLLFAQVTLQNTDTAKINSHPPEEYK
jgi:hypothetical protein